MKRKGPWACFEDSAQEIVGNRNPVLFFLCYFQNWIEFEFRAFLNKISTQALNHKKMHAV
jgi:hypothetical protein